jgi:hypothetical protein
MPLRRYFAYTGGVLLALLFLIDWYQPRPAVDPAHTDIDRSIIRIHSMHKWPGAVAYDTSQPTIVPSAPTVAAEAPVPSAPREAFASAPKPEPTPAAATPPARPATASKHATRRVRVARTRSTRIASYERPSYEQPSYEMFGFRPLFSGRW